MKGDLLSGAPTRQRERSYGGRISITREGDVRMVLQRLFPSINCARSLTNTCEPISDVFRKVKNAAPRSGRRLPH
jgi:hypothetical protein